MFIANLDDQLIHPAPNCRRAHCPSCTAEVIAKTGEHVAWHWAHANGADCDSWADHPMTDWHRAWQECVPLERREVIMRNHRADVITAASVVVEFQHSPIPDAQVREREAHYGTGVWVVDMRHREYIPAWVNQATWRVYLDDGTQWLQLYGGNSAKRRDLFIQWLNEEKVLTSGLLDWSRAKTNNPPYPSCVLCGAPAILIDPDANQPKHKVCAESLNAIGLA